MPDETSQNVNRFYFPQFNYSYGIPYPQAILDTSNYGMMNMQWNLGVQNSIYHSSLWDMSCCGASNYLLDPSLAIWQTQQNWNNGGCYNNCSAWGPIGWAPSGNSTSPSFNGGGFQFPGFNNGGWQIPWSNPWQGGNNGGNPGNSAEAAKLEPYKKIFDRLKKEKVLSDDTIKAYDEAMKKTDIKEKLEAVKKVFESLNKDNINAAILDDDEIKKELYKSGYFFSKENKSNDKKEQLDGDLMNLVNKMTTSGTCEAFSQLSSLLLQSKDSAIIQVMSQWNESDKSEKSIIKYVANHLENGDYKPGIENFVTALMNEADKFSESKETMTKKDALTKEFENVKKVFEKYPDTTDSADGKKYRAELKSALLKLAPKVDDLYAQIRMQQAAEIDNKIKEKYGELNVIPENYVQEETRKDLEGEKISVPKADKIVKKSKYKSEETSASQNEGVDDDADEGKAKVAVSPQNETGIQRTKRLINEGKLLFVQIDNKIIPGYYRTNVHNLIGKQQQFFMLKNDKLVKLNGYINTDGELVLKDGSGKIQLKDIKPEHYTEFNDEDIKTDSNTVTPPEGSDQNDKKTSASLQELKDAQTGNVKTFDKGQKSTMTEKVGNEYKKTSVNGYYCKNNKYYKYDLDKGELVECPEIKKINNVGIATLFDNTTLPLRSVGLSPESQGKKLRELLHGDTSKDDYNKIMQIMNSFSTYTEPDDIVAFLKGYEDERSVFILGWNGRISAQISSENNFGQARKTKCLQIIAKQILKVMDNLDDYTSTDEDYEDMEFYASETDDESTSWRRDGNRWAGVNWFGKGWSFWSSSRTGAANHMDNIIKDVLKKYESN